VAKILIVEDRETTRLMIAETLRRRGHDIVTAATLDEGRSALDDESPDFLLTDLQLPDGSGLELLEKALAADARLPVIVMSAFGTIEITIARTVRVEVHLLPQGALQESPSAVLDAEGVGEMLEEHPPLHTVAAVLRLGQRGRIIAARRELFLRERE